MAQKKRVPLKAFVVELGLPASAECTLRRMFHKGELKGLKLGSRIYIDADEMERVEAEFGNKG